MMTFMVTFCVFLAVILMMAIGVIFHRQSIKGSCGGLSILKVKRVCNCKTTYIEEAKQSLYQIQEPQR